MLTNMYARFERKNKSFRCSSLVVSKKIHASEKEAEAIVYTAYIGL